MQHLNLETNICITMDLLKKAKGGEDIGNKATAACLLAKKKFLRCALPSVFLLYSLVVVVNSQ
jgi:hypothetical protein